MRLGMFLFFRRFQPRMFLRVFLTIFYANILNHTIQVVKLIRHYENEKWQIFDNNIILAISASMFL